MKQKNHLGICFKESLTIRSIERMKTETRRIIHLDQLALADDQDDSDDRLFTYWKKKWGVEYKTTIRESELIRKARYKVDTWVYIKEPVYIHPFDGGTPVYKYDLSMTDERRWKVNFWGNKLFMKKELARHWIFVMGVKVERLHDIDLGGVISEGVHKKSMIDSTTGQEALFFGDYTITKELKRKAREGDRKAVQCLEKVSPYYWITGPEAFRDSFASLINRINGPGTWESNPWVYVYRYASSVFNPLKSASKKEPLKEPG